MKWYTALRRTYAAAAARASAAWAEAASGSERVYTSYKSRTVRATITKLKAITKHRRFSSSSSVEPAMYPYVHRDTCDRACVYSVARARAPGVKKPRSSLYTCIESLLGFFLTARDLPSYHLHTAGCEPICNRVLISCYIVSLTSDMFLVGLGESFVVVSANIWSCGQLFFAA